MAWTIKLVPAAEKKLKKLGTAESKRILAFLRDRVQPSENPRTLAKSLVGDTYSEIWRFRVGDYRILCEIHDEEILILVVDICNRSKIYGGH